ncbi:MAG: PPC domain-containing protein [Sedimentisphaerales bacterium]|nr:PPC domain-containing protein [Sedimentisphaerales bacterium]
MNLSRCFVLWLVTSLTVVSGALAQRNPHIGYVYPAGGRQGVTFEVKIGGQFLDGVTHVYFSNAGVQATVLEYTKPMTQREANALREKLQELQKKTKDSETLKEIADIRKKLATFVRRPPNPAIAEIVTLQVTIAENAELGEGQLRLGMSLGLSNPLIFCVGQLPEFCEKESSSDKEPRGDREPKVGKPPQSSTPEHETSIILPAIVNGQVMSGDVDRFRFQALKGQQLVVVASARELIPYLADAVPGWFQATLSLYDAKGNELAYNDDYKFHPDPVLHYEIPKDGEYVVEIKDAIYRGREDFVYRIAIGELSFVTSIFPLGGQAGVQAAIELKGWNLPAASLTADTKDLALGIRPFSLNKDGRFSNRVLFAVDTLPEHLERELNDTNESADQVALPVIVNGRIDPQGDWDVFRIEGQAGDEIVAEVLARRLDSPLDSVLRLADSIGRQLAFNDDHEDKGSGLSTHHADSYLHATLPANGTYYIHLGDIQRKGGPEYAYRLRISPPHPDFELRIVPSSINVRAGASIPLTVYALRRDGFSNEIALVLKDAPAGFRLNGGRVPANQDQVRLTLTAPPTPLKESLNLCLEGRAMIQGQEVVHPAVPAEDMMQAFAYRHLVSVKDLKVAVIGGARSNAPMKSLDQKPMKSPPPEQPKSQ